MLVSGSPRRTHKVKDPENPAGALKVKGAVHFLMSLAGPGASPPRGDPATLGGTESVFFKCSILKQNLQLSINDDRRCLD